MTPPSLPGSSLPGPASAEAPPPEAGAPAERALVRRGQDAELLTARLVAARRPGQWISALVLLVLFAMLVNTIITNGRFQWGVVGDYFVSGSIMRGLVLTLWLTAAVMGCGFLLGIPFGHEFVTVKTAHLFAKWGVGGDLISKSVLNPATTF